MITLESKIRSAIDNTNEEELGSAISELFLIEDLSSYVGILNELLLVPFHYYHQAITKALQDIKSPSSVPFIKKLWKPILSICSIPVLIPMQ